MRTTTLVVDISIAMVDGLDPRPSKLEDRCLTLREPSRPASIGGGRPTMGSSLGGTFPRRSGPFLACHHNMSTLNIHDSQIRRLRNLVLV